MALKGYKGFDKDLKCRDKQYAIGKVTEEPSAKLCNQGIHFCEFAQDVFSYYAPSDSRYCEIEAEDVSCEKSSDSKRAAKKIRVGAEIGIKGIIEASLKFIFDKVKWGDDSSATGNYSGASVTGDCSGASATGYKSGASAIGDCSGASVTGDYSGASVTGDYSGASATGDCSGASAIGDYSGASATGDCSGASAIGDCSGASVIGYKSGASAIGDCSGASAIGDCSGASAIGDCSGASVIGYKSGASATGYKSGASATGNCSGASVTGDCSGASATGDYSGASAGTGSVATAVGFEARAKGDIGAYIVVTECAWDDEVGQHQIIDCQCKKVDGVEIKADTWYILRGGKFVEVKE